MPPIRSETWILALDSKETRLFRKETASHIVEQDHVIKAEPARTDTPSGRKELGRSFDSSGHGRHIIEPHTSDRTLERMEFADRVSDFLEQSVSTGQFDRLIIIAPAKMLGILRKSLSDTVRSTVLLELDKNCMQMSADQILTLIENDIII